MGASLTLLVCPTERGKRRRRKLGGKVRVESGKVLGGGHMLHQLEKEEEGREEKERRECAAPLGPGGADFIVPPIGGSFYKQCGPPPLPLSHQKWKVGNKSLLPIATALCGLGAPIQVSTSSSRKKIAKSRKAQGAWTRKLSRLS